MSGGVIGCLLKGSRNNISVLCLKMRYVLDKIPLLFLRLGKFQSGILWLWS